MARALSRGGVVSAASILLVGLVLAITAPAHAATTFGADLSATPAQSVDPQLTVTNVIRPGGDFDTGAPVAGVLVSVRVRSSGTGDDVMIRVLRQTTHPNPSDYSFLNVGPQIPMTLQADWNVDGHVTEVNTRHPIEIGDRLGLFHSGSEDGVKVGVNDPTAQCAYIYGAHAVGTTADYSTNSCNHNPVLLAGTIEPDADGDGYGDETQDLCPSLNVTHAACPAPRTSLTRRPHMKTTKKKAKFKFTSDQDAATFECSLDGAAFEACSSPLTVRVGKGKHHFHVRATNPDSGLIDGSPASADWKVKKKHKKHHGNR